MPCFRWFFAAKKINAALRFGMVSGMPIAQAESFLERWNKRKSLSIYFR